MYRDPFAQTPFQKLQRNIEFAIQRRFTREQILTLVILTTNALTPLLYLAKTFYPQEWNIGVYVILGIATLLQRSRLSAPLAFIALTLTTMVEQSLWISLIASYCLSASINTAFIPYILPSGSVPRPRQPR